MWDFRNLTLKMWDFHLQIFLSQNSWVANLVLKCSRKLSSLKGYVRETRYKAEGKKAKGRATTDRTRPNAGQRHRQFCLIPHMCFDLKNPAAASRAFWAAPNSRDMKKQIQMFLLGRHRGLGRKFPWRCHFQAATGLHSDLLEVSTVSLTQMWCHHFQTNAPWCHPDGGSDYQSSS